MCDTCLKWASFTQNGAFAIHMKFHVYHNFSVFMIDCHPLRR